MAYCRWSSDNFKCDVYAYEDSLGGWTIHVANNRVAGEVPPISYEPDKFSESYQTQMNFIRQAKTLPIGLPYDGFSFRENTLADFEKTLRMLKQTGYVVPDFVFELIRDEKS